MWLIDNCQLTFRRADHSITWWAVSNQLQALREKTDFSEEEEFCLRTATQKPCLSFQPTTDPADFSRSSHHIRQFPEMNHIRISV